MNPATPIHSPKKHPIVVFYALFMSQFKGVNDALPQILGVKREWNQITNFAQFKISPGATIIEGRASSQGVGLSGGQFQKYNLNLSDLRIP
jgi:hypothetical protein